MVAKDIRYKFNMMKREQFMSKTREPGDLIKVLTKQAQ